MDEKDNNKEPKVEEVLKMDRLPQLDPIGERTENVTREDFHATDE